MNEITPTNLRANLFKYLEQVAKGFALKVKTRSGVVVLYPESSNEKKDSRALNFSRPKIKGKICDSLEQADKELAEYIKVPK